MKATYVKAPNLIELRDEAVPEPASNEVLIKLAACGVCGTDLHIAHHLATDWQPLGHELSGVVVATGRDVTRIRTGDRVVVECSTPCGQCRACRSGHPIRCRDKVGFYGSRSGYAEYLAVHERAVVSIGEMDFVTAALVEPLSVALGTVSKIEPGPDDTVLIIGPGPIGLMALAACRRVGVHRAILAGRSHSRARLQLGEALGADRVVRVDQEDLAAVVRQEFPDGVDKVISTAHPESVLEAIDLVNADGIISYIGFTDADRLPLTIDAHTLHFKQLQLRPFAGPSSPFTYPAIDLLRNGLLPVDRFVTEIVPLVQVEQALRSAATDKERGVKVVVAMDGLVA